MKKILILLLILMCSINPKNGIAQSPNWFDSLRINLNLDKALVCDSIVNFSDGGHEHRLYIDKNRPNLLNAKIIIDSIMFDNNDTTISRIITILQEFDARYQVEFFYNKDYYRNYYHSGRKHRIELNEYTILGALEQVILVKNYLLNHKKEDVFEVLMGVDETWNEINYISTTWRNFGWLRMDHVFSIFKHYKSKLMPTGLLLLEKELSQDREISYDYLNSFFRHLIMPNEMCNILSQIRVDNLVDEIEAYLNNYSKFKSKDQVDCINDFIRRSK